MPNPLAELQNFNIAGNAQNALLQGMQVGAAMRQRKEQRERAKAHGDERGALIGATGLLVARDVVAERDVARAALDEIEALHESCAFIGVNGELKMVTASVNSSCLSPVMPAALSAL